MRHLLLTACAAAALSVVVAAPASASGLDDNEKVCLAAAETVTGGLTEFVEHMDDVSSKATGGDLVGAEQSVKDAGTKLVSVGGELRKDAENADDAELKATVEELAKEFESLGKSLTGLTSLQNFDTTKLDKVADEMSAICGTTPLPTLPSPSPSAS